ncbi:MAG TPA: tRNA pseudouridine(55) synthase TruB [Thermomicrobiales bacterium]|nr:tRNA pseudouridine(55) synthase TruB [Thermomicrobiales bacterium]
MPPGLNGLLLVDKPVGITSHDVVSRVRRLVGMTRVGHGGTLDPFASGVVVVAVGQATRVLQYVQHSDKRYLAHVVLGVETDSHDIEGEILARRAVTEWPSVSDVEQAASLFTGAIEQVPPRHSAIKIAGRKMYDLARAGVKVDVPSRSVNVYSIDVLSYDPPDLRIAVHCGKGTYIRSIARDIGSALGIGAYCHGLRRYVNGPFCLKDCWTLDDLDEAHQQARWSSIAIHPDAAIAHLDALVVDETGVAAWYHGRSIHVSTTRLVDDGALLRVYASDGRFLGVGRSNPPDIVQPKLVFSSQHGIEDE